MRSSLACHRWNSSASCTKDFSFNSIVFTLGISWRHWRIAVFLRRVSSSSSSPSTFLVVPSLSLSSYICSIVPVPLSAALSKFWMCSRCPRLRSHQHGLYGQGTPDPHSSASARAQPWVPFFDGVKNELLTTTLVSVFSVKPTSVDRMTSVGPTTAQLVFFQLSEHVTET